MDLPALSTALAAAHTDLVERAPHLPAGSVRVLAESLAVADVLLAHPDGDQSYSVLMRAHGGLSYQRERVGPEAPGVVRLVDSVQAVLNAITEHRVVPTDPEFWATHTFCVDGAFPQPSAYAAMRLTRAPDLVLADVEPRRLPA
jgi:hypothetical protein